MTAAYLLLLLPAAAGSDVFPTHRDPLAETRDIAPDGYRDDREERAAGFAGPGTGTRLAAHLVGSHTIRLLNRPLTSAGRLAFFVLDSSGAWVRRADVRFRRFPFLSRKPAPPVAGGRGMDLGAWEQELDRTTPFSRMRGRLTFLIGGQPYFERLEAALHTANRSIDMQTYIFDNDDVAQDIADLLKTRSEQVDVRVLFDGLGTLMAHGADAPTLPASHQAPKNMKRYLEGNSQVQARSIENVWLTGDHSKNIIIDRRVAFVGGMNVGREYRHEWHDMMVEVRGATVNALSDEFEVAWARSGHIGDLGLLWNGAGDRASAATDGDYPIRVITSSAGRAYIYLTHLQAARRARSYIYLENAYFADDALLYELCRARKRGVDVRVIMPAEPNHEVMRRSNKIAARTLLKHGVRVYVYPGMSHIKAAVFDGWACVGTANYDKLSLRVNREISLAFSHRDAVDRLKKQLFERDFDTAREIVDPEPIDLADHLWELVADEV